MKKYFLTLVMGHLVHMAAGQHFSSNNPNYVKNVQAGEAALKAEKYDACLTYYEEAFRIKQTSYLSTLRAASCAFLARDTPQFHLYLEKAFEISWDGTKDVFDTYPEFAVVRESQMAEVVSQAWQKAIDSAGVDMALIRELKQIRKTDQQYRRQMDAVSEKYGQQSKQMDSLWYLQSQVDSINTARVTQMIDERGYPGKSLVGDGQASTAFLVIQHADLAVQEKYLPIIMAAAAEGEVRWSSVALLIDRIKMRHGEKQIYGSQLSVDPISGDYFFAPIENPHQIDSIRATVGLSPIQEYADRWNLTWDVDKHLKRQGEK